MIQAQITSGRSPYLHLETCVVSPFIVSIPSEKLLDAIKFSLDRKKEKCGFKILDIYRQNEVQQSPLCDEKIILVWSRQPELILSEVDSFKTKFTHPPSDSNCLSPQSACSGNSTKFISILEHLIPLKECRLVIDNHIYHQSTSKLLRLSDTYKWEILPIDMRKTGSMDKILHIDFVIVDSPLNWYLSAIDIKEISFQAKCKNALVLVGSNALELYNLRLT